MDIKEILKKLFGEKTKQNELPDDPIHYCCMCGAPETDVNLIIRGGGNNYICDRCASMIHYQMDELYKYASEIKNNEQKSLKPEKIEIATPHEIKDFLDQYIIGQDEAKIKLAVAVYNHYKRINQNKDDVDIEKSNILMCGASGTGKTLLAQTIAKFLDVPITIVGAQSFTQAGYVGEDVENIIARLYHVANGDIKKAERGIVFIDEIDKIATKSENPSITRDVGGEGVQQALLKIIEGTKVKFSPDSMRKRPDQELIEMDTKNILFICAGAFVGIERKISNRLNIHAVGFSTEKKSANKNGDLMKHLLSEDIQAYGIIPELVGRLPIIAALEPLSKETLHKILTEPKNAIIKQYIKLFEMDGVKLSFDEETLDYIVERALTMKLGARGLRSIVEEIMTQYMFDMPTLRKKKLKITKEYAEEIFNNKK